MTSSRTVIAIRSKFIGIDAKGLRVAHITLIRGRALDKWAPVLKDKVTCARDIPIHP